ncbi:MAG: hypothetical protein JNL63_03725, partial [Bacteroidia bacterium]|nr:hypothetical protein [Bacteroidia bacterium]
MRTIFVLLFFIIFIDMQALSTGYTTIAVPGDCQSGENSIYVKINWTSTSECTTVWYQVQRTTDPSWSSAINVGNRRNAAGGCLIGYGYSEIDYTVLTPGVSYYYRIQTLSSNPITGPSYDYDYLSGSIVLTAAHQSDDWKSQVTMTVNIGTTPNDLDQYTWSEVANIKQGVNINL